MEKEITLKQLEKFSKNFQSSKLNLVASNAVQSSGVNKAAFSTLATRELKNQFSIEVKNPLDMTNQKQSGRCWMFAGLNVIRHIIAKQLNVKNIELSQSYLMFFDKLEKSNYELEYVLNHLDAKDDDRTFEFMLQTGGQQDGGYWNYFTSLIKKYGVCPKQCMPETFDTSASSSMDNVINTLITKDVSIIRNKYKEGVKLDKLLPLKEKMLNEIYRVLAICIGEPVTKFTYEYQEDGEQHKDEKDKNKSKYRSLTSTPIEFYNTYVKESLDNYVLLVNWPAKNFKMYQSYVATNTENVVSGDKCLAYNVPIADIKQALIASLKDNKVSWFACDVLASSSRKEGYLATTIYDYDNLLDIKLGFDKGDRLMLRASACNHAMTFSGVNLVHGRPNRWKVENSWGSDIAFKGVFVMEDKWFDEYVYEVVVEKQYLNEKVLKALDTKPVEIPVYSSVNLY